MADRQSNPDVTALLRRAQAGDTDAFNRLLPVVYEELRRVARARLRNERPGHTLQATALVHEAYLRLTESDLPSPQNRTHFFAVAARLMRQILVDHARKKHATKRGAGATVISLSDAAAAPDIALVDVLTVDDALVELAALDARLCQVVELKFFAGMSIAETAQALKVSTATVERDWTVAKAWLHQRLSPSNKRT
jgi:RNA polymerase sigma factor (TIGR02999 family)